VYSTRCIRDTIRRILGECLKELPCFQCMKVSAFFGVLLWQCASVKHALRTGGCSHYATVSWWTLRCLQCRGMLQVCWIWNKVSLAQKCTQLKQLTPWLPSVPPLFSFETGCTVLFRVVRVLHCMYVLLLILSFWMLFALPVQRCISLQLPIQWVVIHSCIILLLCADVVFVCDIYTKI
jgi:hypothetical protein